MNYEESVTKVLTAMGWVRAANPNWWDEPNQASYGEPPTDRCISVHDLDANFVVERVIPWADAQALRVRLFPHGISWYVEVEPHAQSIRRITRPSFPEAVIMAVAEALG